MSSNQPVEIERKFLVHANHLPEAILRFGAEIQQGYLSIRPTVRVRVTQHEGGAPQAWLTVKGPGGLVRAEYEYPIPVGHATAMLGLCEARIHKTRYRVRVGSHTWDLDRYKGNLGGLWTAEIELRSPNEDFVMPPWIDREVTDDPSYTNAAMALRFIP